MELNSTSTAHDTLGLHKDKGGYSLQTPAFVDIQ